MKTDSHRLPFAPHANALLGELFIVYAVTVQAKLIKLSKSRQQWIPFLNLYLGIVAPTAALKYYAPIVTSVSRDFSIIFSGYSGGSIERT